MQSEVSDAAYKIYFRACICHLCVDGINATNALSRFCIPIYRVQCTLYYIYRYSKEAPGFAESKEANIIKVGWIYVELVIYFNKT